MFTPEIAEFVRTHRVARLATADAGGSPYAVPICYAFDGARLYSAIDLKPKRVGGNLLKRVRNITENPNVAVVIDDYSEDWSELAYVLLRGRAEIIGMEGEAGGDTEDDVENERRRAETMLRAKYPQYAEMLQPGCAVIRITPQRVIGWGAIGAGDADAG